MNEIDWDKAPEGATHYMAESSTDYECWLKKQGYTWFYMRANGQVWMKATIDDDSLRTITERPSPAWSGEGLPPVGTVCLHKNNGLEKMRVFAIDGKWAAVSSEFSKFWCPVNELIPIRTPEQIVAAEREAALHAAICDVEEKVAKWNTTIDCSAAIKATIDVMISLGYRKP